MSVEGHAWRRQNLGAAVVSLVLVSAVLWPMFRPDQRDSFPFSTFPMFSREHESTSVDIPHVLAVFADGSRLVLPPELATGHPAALQAQVSIRHAMTAGQPALASLCQRAALRLCTSRSFRAAVALEIATDTVDARVYFEPRKSQASHARTVQLRCWTDCGGVR